VAVLQVAENLAALQAADTMRSRMDWQYLLGLDLGALGFDFAILSEFRARLRVDEVAQRLLDALLDEPPKSGFCVRMPCTPLLWT
jgi:transposase